MRARSSASAHALNSSGEHAAVGPKLFRRPILKRRALCRTRTGDPFLTIVLRGRTRRTLAVTVDLNVPANRQVVGLGS